MTHELHRASCQLAYQVLYAVQHTRWHQIKTSEKTEMWPGKRKKKKTSEVPVWVPPSPSPESWSNGCQNQKGLGVGCSVLGKAAVVGPADGERRRLHFFTIWMTSSSSNVWSLPTFWGLCFTERPQTRALYGREKRTVSINNHLASSLATQVPPFHSGLAFQLLRATGLQQPWSPLPIKNHTQSSEALASPIVWHTGAFTYKVAKTFRSSVVPFVPEPI